MQNPFVRWNIWAIACICSISLLIFGWTSNAIADEEMASRGEVLIYSTEASPELLGNATFVPMDDELQVNVTLSDVPSGYHGFHIHEFGSCDDGGSAAGGHFNPLETQHGYLPKEGLNNAHAGDLGNILIFSDGSGTLQETLPDMPLAEGELAIAGHAVILHAERDDFGQPTGNAGGRLACGIIEVAGQTE